MYGIIQITSYRHAESLLARRFPAADSLWDVSMMNKKWTALLLAGAVVLSAGGAAEAGWLGKVVDAAVSSATSGQTQPTQPVQTQPATEAAAPAASTAATNRALNPSAEWVEVHQAKRYTVYVDRTSLKAIPDQYDKSKFEVLGCFKRVYTDAGRAWIAQQDDHLAGTDLAYSVYWATYGPKNSVFSWYKVSEYGPCRYYDSQNRLLHDEGVYKEIDDAAGSGYYNAKPVNKKIRDTVYEMVSK